MNIGSLIKYVAVLIILQACAAQKNSENSGTLEGVTGVFQGNCMPSPGQPPCKPTPVSTTVFITSQSESFSMELLKDSVVSAENGKYKISLPAGDYSLFLRDGNEIACRSIRCDGPCLCEPFSIVADSTTVIDPTLDRASW